MSRPLADASLAYFQTFENPVKTEGDATLEQISSYAGQLPFMADSHLRPDGFGLLDHQMLMPLSSSPKYAHFNGSLEVPSYVENLPFLCLRHWDSLRRLGPVTIKLPGFMLILPTPFAWSQPLAASFHSTDSPLRGFLFVRCYLFVGTRP